MSSFIKFGSKKPGYYKGILMKADSELHHQIDALVKQYADKNALILDMGAGEGALSQRLFDSGFKLISADIDSSQFKAVGPQFFQIDFNDVKNVSEFAENHSEYFDVVMGIEVIEHVENPWEYVRLLKKMVKKGGRIIISTPNTSSWLSRFDFLFTGKFLSFNNQTAEEYGHVSPISPWELELILNKEGFSNVEIKSAGYLPSIWITSNFLITVSVKLSLFFRPFMKGISKGWCVIATGQK